MKKEILKVKGIHKSFSGVHVLKGVDLNLYEGEVHALMGENGAGKSTLIKILCGIYKYDTGSMELFGTEVNFNTISEAQAMIDLDNGAFGSLRSLEAFMVKRICVVLISMLLIIGVFGCSNSEKNKKNNGGKGTIAIIAKGETHAFWQAIKKGSGDAANDAGYDITFRGPTAESEEYVNVQREMLQAALNKKDTKAIVLATIGLGFSDELIAAYNKGLPVVEFDSGLYSNGADITIDKDPTVGSVATDNKAAAAIAAENFYGYLQDNHYTMEGFKIGIIQHDSTSTGIDRAIGFKDKIEELAKADGVTLNINIQVKTNNTDEYRLGLISLKDWGAQAIFMTNEGVVNEVFHEISDNVSIYKKILFCGFDAGTNQYDWIKDEGENYALLVGSVAQDSYSIGYKAVELAVKKLNSEEIEDLGISGVWYNAENIDDLIVRNIFYLG